MGRVRNVRRSAEFDPSSSCVLQRCLRARHPSITITMHSGMVGDVVVMEPKDYEAWMGGGGNQPLALTGEKLFSELGCVTCHRTDTQGRGPNLVGIFGKPVLLEDGRTITADENYVRESILNPAAKIVQGYQPVMPTFKGQVTEEELIQLVNYVKTLKAADGAAEARK